MMKLWPALAFVVSLLAGLIAYAPADKLVPYAFASAQLPLQPYEVSGRLLAGRIGYLQTGAAPVESLSWRLHPASLLTGALSAEIELEPAGAWVQARVRKGLGATTRLSDVRATASLDNLKSALQIPFMPIQGQLSADFDEIIIEGQTPVSASGIARLGNTVWSLSQPPAELGIFRADVSSEDGSIVAAIVDEDARLDIEGEARLNPDRSYVLNAKLKATAETPEAVANNLKTLGRTDSQGWYSLTQRGQLR